MENVISTIITGIIATIIFEVLKLFVLKLIDLTKKARIPFSLTGFWVSYNQSEHPETHQIYSAYELIKLSIKRGRINVKIFQLTNDSRKHKYKGCGYIRGSKLSISYEEYAKQKSELTGCYILKVSKKNEHNIFLNGSYTEFQGSMDKIFSHDYCMFPYNTNRINRIGLNLCGGKYIFKHMQKDSFKENVNNEMQEMRNML